LESFVGECKKRNIEIVFTSRNPSWKVQQELIAHVVANPKDNGWFRGGAMIAGYYTAEGTPKDFSSVLEGENAEPEELFVIGSNEARDIEGARKVGAHFQIVRPYKTPFSWGNLGYGLVGGFESIISRHIKLFGEEPKAETSLVSAVQLPKTAFAY